MGETLVSAGCQQGMLSFLGHPKLLSPHFLLQMLEIRTLAFLGRERCSGAMGLGDLRLSFTSPV